MGIRMGPNCRGIARLIGAVAIAGFILSTPAFAGTQVSAASSPAHAPAISQVAATASPADAAKTSVKPTVHERLKSKAHALHKKVRALLHKLNPKRAYLAARYRKAVRTFPGFCNQWQAKLDARNSNNLSHLKWQAKNGWETALYTGYGKITRCQTKESKEGVPIGKLKYEEYSYYIVGRSRDEALHAKPKTLAITDTLEIFRFDHGRWFY